MLTPAAGKTLEELDQVFSVPTRVHARYGAKQIPYFFQRYVLWQDVAPPRLPVVAQQQVEYHDSTFGATKESSPVGSL